MARRSRSPTSRPPPRRSAAPSSRRRRRPPARSPRSPAPTLWLKFENLQFTGSFKERGARNFLAHLAPDGAARGVVAASAGNHAQGVAYHAAPARHPGDDRDAGGHAVHEGREHRAPRRARRAARRRATPSALAEAQRIADDTGATLVPAFDDPLVIAGQGTVGLELLAQVPDARRRSSSRSAAADSIAGIAVAVKAPRPRRARRRRAGRGLRGHDARARPRARADRRRHDRRRHRGDRTRRAHTDDRRASSSTTSSSCPSSASKKRSRSASRSKRPCSKARAPPGWRRVLEHPAPFRGRRVGGRAQRRQHRRPRPHLGAAARARRVRAGSCACASRCPTGPACSRPSPADRRPARGNIVDVDAPPRSSRRGAEARPARGLGRNARPRARGRDRAVSSTRRASRSRSHDPARALREGPVPAGVMTEVRVARADEYARVGELTVAAYQSLAVDHLWGGYDREILDTATTRDRRRSARGRRRRPRRRCRHVRRRRVVALERVDAPGRGTVSPPRGRRRSAGTRRGRNAGARVHRPRRAVTPAVW